ncbi:hypothetical protein DLE03_05555 [Actinobacteria bacterium IMCC25003]|nr:hypothetical protein DLE03_05555 [Actinobacteria bacterium IMCC25003]
MKRIVFIGVIASLLSFPLTSFAATSINGPDGQSLTVTSSQVKNDTKVTVTGKGFDETIGIYLAYCILPKKGAAPTPCGGGADIQGVKEASFWISSNPPAYGAGLAIAFQPGGRFKEQVAVTKKIGNFDCTKVRCAITVRSDHLHEGDRTHDLFIPISFTRK